MAFLALSAGIVPATLGSGAKAQTSSTHDANGCDIMIKEPQPDGSVKYVDAANGGYSSVPPPGFDPLTASAADLAKYGVIARPTDPTGLAMWNKHITDKAYVPKWCPLSRAPTLSGTPRVGR